MAFNAQLLFALVFALFTSIVSSAPATFEQSPKKYNISVYDIVTIKQFLGNDAYSVEVEREEEDFYTFAVFADGYNLPTPGWGRSGKQPVDILTVTTGETKRLTVYSAWNGLDETPNRMKMRDILKGCWMITGLQPSELKEVLGSHIDNKQMKAALALCRKSLKLETSDSFVLAITDTDEQKKACWQTLQGTVFGSSIERSIQDFALNKQLIAVKVDNSGGSGADEWDNVFYQFS